MGPIQSSTQLACVDHLQFTGNGQTNKDMYSRLVSSQNAGLDKAAVSAPIDL